MTRARVNPHARGTPEHLLHNRWRLASQKAATLRREANALFTEAGAEQAKADHYAKALDALGHTVTPQSENPRLLEGPKS